MNWSLPTSDVSSAVMQISPLPWAAVVAITAEIGRETNGSARWLVVGKVGEIAETAKEGKITTGKNSFSRGVPARASAPSRLLTKPIAYRKVRPSFSATQLVVVSRQKPLKTESSFHAQN